MDLAGIFLYHNKHTNTQAPAIHRNPADFSGNLPGWEFAADPLHTSSSLRLAPCSGCTPAVKVMRARYRLTSTTRKTTVSFALGLGFTADAEADLFHLPSIEI